MTASKIQEGKDSVERDFTFVVAIYLEVLDMKPRSSGSGRETERHRPVKSPPLQVILVHILFNINISWLKKMNQIRIVIVMMKNL
jgi:hypothetical protein